MDTAACDDRRDHIVRTVWRTIAFVLSTRPSDSDARHPVVARLSRNPRPQNGGLGCATALTM
jgi:hypothetical protein